MFNFLTSRAAEFKEWLANRRMKRDFARASAAGPAGLAEFFDDPRCARSMRQQHQRLREHVMLGMSRWMRLSPSSDEARLLMSALALASSEQAVGLATDAFSRTVKLNGTVAQLPAFMADEAEQHESRARIAELAFWVGPIAGAYGRAYERCEDEEQRARLKSNLRAMVLTIKPFAHRAENDAVDMQAGWRDAFTAACVAQGAFFTREMSLAMPFMRGRSGSPEDKVFGITDRLMDQLGVEALRLELQEELPCSDAGPASRAKSL